MSGWVQEANGSYSFTLTSGGKIYVSASDFNNFPESIRTINSGDYWYHEYKTYFDTGLKPGSVSVNILDEFLIDNPTPFTTNFAGPGFVFSANFSEYEVVNVTSGAHLLYPGVVGRSIILRDGTYHIETIGMGNGYFGEINSIDWLTNFVWDQAGVNFLQDLFEHDYPGGGGPVHPDGGLFSGKSTDTSRYAIGNEGVDFFAGSSAADEFVGRGGADVFIAAGGNDILNGGEGSDTYVVSSGNVTIYDSDGRGYVRFGSGFLSGTDGCAEEGPLVGKHGETYEELENGLSILLPGGAGSVYVDDWTNGELGIQLKDSCEPDPWPPSPPSPPRDPLVLDLDGDGVELIGVKNSTAHFDFAKDGFREQTGWVSPDDALLVKDLNGNDVVNGIDELFGSLTEDGFTALRAFDDNKDGRVDEADTNFASLRLWRDLDSDGVSDAGELFQLADYGVVALELNAVESQRAHEGNLVALEGKFVMSDGSKGAAEAILFATNATVSKWDPPVGFEPDPAALALPNLRGYGLLPDLAYSMTLNAGLRGQAAAFVENLFDSPAASVRPAFAELLYAWAGVSGVAPDARGDYVDARKVAFLEKFFGGPLAGFEETELSSRSAGPIDDNFNAVADTLLTRFLTQASRAAMKLGVDADAVAESPFVGMSLLVYDAEEDQFVNGDIPGLVQHVFEGTPTAEEARLDYILKAVIAVSGFSFEYFDSDKEALIELVADAILSATGSAPLSMLARGIGGQFVVGTAAGETLTGGLAADVLIGGGGDDTLGGGAGVDIYMYSRGDGNDTIAATYDLEVYNDKLVFTDLNAANVSFARSGDNLVINIPESAPSAGDAGSITFTGALKNNELGVGEVIFADGTRRTPSEIASALHNPTSGDDVIQGFNVDETIRGGGGNDTIDGSWGSDTYVYARGDGNDTIAAGENLKAYDDTIVFTDIDEADVSFSRDGNNLLINIKESAPGAGDAGSIKLTGALNGGWLALGEIQFADGPVWDAGDIASALVKSTSGDDTILGFNLGETIRGGQGNDTIDGRRGGDTYVYARGDGNDVISDSNTVEGPNDRLIFEDIPSTDVSLVRNEDALIILIAESTPGAGDGGQITLPDHWGIYHHAGVELFSFSDGVTWDRGDIAEMVSQQSTPGDDFIQGDYHAQTFSGGRGNDTIRPGGGADTFLYSRGDGHDTIGHATADYNDGLDTLIFMDIDPEEVTLSRDGDDLTVTIEESAPGAGDNGSVLLVERLDPYEAQSNKIVFADGTIWTDIDIAKMLLVQNATSGNDILLGSPEDDVLIGGAGNDTLDGGRGIDTYKYSRGDGADTIEEGVNTSVSPSAYDLADQLLLVDIVASEVSLVRNGVDVTLVIAESSAGAGDGGSILLKDGINDNYWDTSIDEVVFAGGAKWTRADMRAMLLAQASTSGNDTITGFNVGDVINAGAGDDTINSGEGDDTIRGGAGNDVINGGLGEDTYLYARGDGSDTISEPRYVSGYNDRLKFLDINTPDLIALRNNNDLILMVGESSAGAGDGGTIVLKSTLEDGSVQGIESFEFANGTVLDRAGMLALINGIGGTNGDDTINGTSAADNIQAGLGNDRLIGAAGSDSYFYRSGDGNDTIEEITSGTDVDRLVLADLNQADLRFERPFSSLNDVVLRVVATNQTITLKTQMDKEGGIEQIVFADGTTLGGTDWSLDGQLLNLVTIYGTSAGETIWGSSSNDTIDPGAGNDTFGGEYGSDTLIYAAGYGNDVIDEKADGTDTDTLKLVGLNQADIRFERPPSDLTDVVIHINATGETLRLDNQFDKEDGVERIVFADGTVLGGDDWSLDNILLSLVSISGTSGNDTLTGTTGADRMYGFDGNDVLNGGAGADTLIGGLGDDTYVVDNVGDVVVEATGEGLDLVQSSVTYALSADVENLTLTGSTAINATGNALANVLTGNSGNNILSGAAGGDTLNGGNGTDTAAYADSAAGVTVDLLASTASGGDAAGDTFNSIENLSGSGYADTLTGNAAANVLTGLAGNDLLDGGAGNDTLVGGLGDDTYTVDATGDIVTELADEGTDLVKASVTYTVSANVENLTLTGSAALNGTGNALANAITGNSGNNVLAGLAGADQLTGGDGIDTATYVASAAAVKVSLTSGVATGGDAEGDVLSGIENLTGSNHDDELEGDAGTNVLAGGSGTDLVTYRNAASGVTVNLATTTAQATGGGGSDTLSAIENLEGSAFADVLTGSSAANTLRGLAGDDTLNGAAGADTLIGGLGNDIYVVDNAGDTVVELEAEGTDLVQASVSIALSSHVENLTLTGSGAINGTGNADANTITGNSGNNILEGGAGGDKLDGSGGTDTVSYAASSAAVTIDLAANTATGGDATGDTLAGFENATGSAFADALTGNTAANTLMGLAGNDTLNGGAGHDILDGGAGVDVMIGGLGNDTFVVDDAADTVTEVAGEGTDTVQASISYVLGDNIETLTLTGAAAIDGTGNTLANTLTGNAEANVLTGGGGNDSLDGGAGADTLLGGDGNDTLVGGLGADAMSGGIGNDSYTVDDAADTIEELSGEGTDSVSASVTYGLSAHVENLTLSGSAAINGSGNDLANVLTGNSGNNQLSGGDGNDTLTGGNGADTLLGGIGNDLLTGGVGLDILTGGDEDDTFDFNATTETAVLLLNADLITDFVQGDDLIDLSGIDASTSTSGNNAFSFVGTSAFTGLGQARYAQLEGETVVELNTTGDNNADAVIRITGIVNFAASDFVL